MQFEEIPIEIRRYTQMSPDIFGHLEKHVRDDLIRCIQAYDGSKASLEHINERYSCGARQYSNLQAEEYGWNEPERSSRELDGLAD